MIKQLLVTPVRKICPIVIACNTLLANAVTKMFIYVLHAFAFGPEVIEVASGADPVTRMHQEYPGKKFIIAASGGDLYCILYGTEKMVTKADAARLANLAPSDANTNLRPFDNAPVEILIPGNCMTVEQKSAVFEKNVIIAAPTAVKIGECKPLSSYEITEEFFRHLDVHTPLECITICMHILLVEQGFQIIGTPAGKQGDLPVDWRKNLESNYVKLMYQHKDSNASLVVSIDGHYHGDKTFAVINASCVLGKRMAIPGYELELTDYFEDPNNFGFKTSESVKILLAILYKHVVEQLKAFK